MAIAKKTKRLIYLPRTLGEQRIDNGQLLFQIRLAKLLPVFSCRIEGFSVPGAESRGPVPDLGLDGMTDSLKVPFADPCK